MVCENSWTFGLLARALRQEGVYVDFCSTHAYYWTSFMYLRVPGSSPDSKRAEDLDKTPWLGPGHPTVLETLADIPRGARACDKARARRFLGISGDGATSKKGDVSFTDKEFSEHVVAKNLTAGLQLQAWVAQAKAQGSDLPVEERLVYVGMESYMYKYQTDPDRRVAFAWEAHAAPIRLAERSATAWDFVFMTSTDGQCVCNGEWIPLTEQLLSIQVQRYPPELSPHEAPSSVAVRAALRRALQQGCAKRTKVFIYGPKDAGKSHVLKPIVKAFGDLAYTRPVGKGNYPLQDLFDKKVVVLQDLRVHTYKLDFDALLVWWEGEEVRVPVPQNGAHKGDRVYKERAPVFASAGSKLRIPAEEAARLRLDASRQNDMVDERWTYFHHAVSLPKAALVESVPPCPKCWCSWVCSHGECSPAVAAAAPAPVLGAFSAPPPDRAPRIAVAAPPNRSPPVEEAKDALLDWLESHGGVIVCDGPATNLAAVADGVSWGQRFHSACGRLLPFLRQHGRQGASPHTVVGFA